MPPYPISIPIPIPIYNTHPHRGLIEDGTSTAPPKPTPSAARADVNPPPPSPAAGLDPRALERRRDVRAARHLGPAPPPGAGGALRPVDWRACAAAVTAHRAASGRAPRTVEQCKNRMDYLKKRLRAERFRSKGPEPPPPVSGSLDRLRALLHLSPSVPPGFAPRGSAMPKVNKEEESSAVTLPRDWPPVPKRPRTAVLLSPVSSSSGHHHEAGGRGCREVAAALDRLAGMYERVEAAKQSEAARLEERRLEAMRDLEIERMRILVDVAISTSAGTDSTASSAEELGQQAGHGSHPDPRLFFEEIISMGN